MNEKRDRNCGRRKMWLAIGALTAMWGSSIASAQQTTTSNLQQAPLNDPHVAPGKLLAEGQNAVPVGPLNLLIYRLEEVALPRPVEFGDGQSAQQESTKNDPQLAAGRLVANGESKTPIGENRLLTYKLEEVDLPKPLEFKIRGKTHTLSTVLRLTITSESISGAHTIWIDDAALPRVFGLGAHAIGTFIYDRSILRDGAEISVSDSREFVTLPERLRLPKEFSASIEPLVEEGNSIVGIHSTLRIIGSVRQPLIQIEMRTNRTFPVRNAAVQLQIGKQFFMNELGGDPSGHSLTVNLTPKAFAELKDGAEVIAFYNYPDRSGASAKEIWYFGRLNKRVLDR